MNAAVLATLGLLDIAQGVTPPANRETASAQVEEAVAPDYPENACAALVEGRVTVDVTSLPNGGLGETRAEGIPLLQAAAVPAALAWRFVPSPAPSKVRLTFLFKVIRQPDGVTSRTTAVFRPPYEIELRCRPFRQRVSVSGE